MSAVFWTVNWSDIGLRTHWAFFPMWLGYCLMMDALVYLRKGTSLATRSWQKYIGLFLVSAPVWWMFEIINWRVQNWHYHGAEFFSPVEFWLWATLNFTTVVPAVFGTAELVGSFAFIKRFSHGLKVIPNLPTTVAFFICGLIMFVMMFTWPKIFFPFIWLSIYFMLEPVNAWVGNLNLGNWTRHGDWRPVFSLWIGVLIVAFFWEMWNFLSYPKWIYSVPWGGCCKIFEMPLLGYGGYLPFALELFAMYHLVVRLFRAKNTGFVKIVSD